MPASRNSKPRPNSKHAAHSWLALAAVVVLLAAISSAAVWWFFSSGYTLYYGDAAAHLNIARRIVDSRTFTMKLWGTVWLPLPHLLMLPFVRVDEWWRTGLAGAIPSAACFVVAGTLLFAALRRALGSPLAAMAGTFVFALNPNLLYLQAAPMTEAVFFAALAGMLCFSLAWRDTGAWWAFAGAALATIAATLTRYEGWVLVPLMTLFMLAFAPRRKLVFGLAFGIVASLGAAWWVAHNWWFWGDPLEFYRGPWSANAIYHRQLAQGMQRYPGDGDWSKAFLYYRTAAELASGWALFWIGLAGVAAALVRKAWWPVLLCVLPPAFYLLSLHNSGTPIFVPGMWPNSYYNTRYGLALLPLLAVGIAGIVALTPTKMRGYAAVLLVLASIAPWLLYARAESWVCWKESKVNSDARRAWSKQAADYLRAHYRPGDGVFYSFGDLTVPLQMAGVPMRETLHDGDELRWNAALARPDWFANETWVVVQSGDGVSDALHRVRRPGVWERVETIVVKDATPVEIYRRRIRP